LKEKIFKIRKYCEDDCKLLWKWANDPNVRKFSFYHEYIPWENHLEWFKSKLKNQDCIIYIALNDKDKPIGQIRFEISKEEANISISLDCRFRGMGYGHKLIMISSEKIFNSSEVKIIHSYVKLNNIASLQAFERAGYKKIGKKIIQKQEASHLIYNKYNTE
jgi:UDP-2,4-diacetamido-2,4,6-trideoxy-beta-L-altropyranose hydrolase